MARHGHIALCGVGVGDPDLLTTRAVYALRQAAMAVIPAATPAAVRDLLPAAARCVNVADDTVIDPDDPLHAEMVAEVAGGALVVRLYRDEPILDSVATAELQALERAGIPFRIIPGPSRALIAAAYAGITLDLSDRPVTLAAARSRHVAGPQLVVLDRAEDAASVGGDGLLVHQPALPAQRVTARGGSPEPGDVLVIGDGLSVRPRSAWFERLPLFGRRVLVTRAGAQAAGFARALRELGAEPVMLPVIAVAPPEDCGPLDRAVEQVGTYDWVVFTSANGVDAFFDRLMTLGYDTRRIGPCRIAAIGSATAARLAERSLRADFVPERFVAEEIVTGLVARGVVGRRVLLARAAQARDVLPDGLRAAGATVDVVAAYRIVRPEPDPTVLERVLAGEIDIVTFTSSSTVRNLVAMLGGHIDTINQATVACIGPITAATARELGLRVDLMAETYSIPGLIDALIDNVEGSRS